MDQENRQFNGFYRAFVVDNKDPEVQGRVKVWIPDVMPEVEQTKGLWARPANNVVGGRNTEYDQSHTYMGSSYIPKNGSWLWIFFEKGDLNFPWYFTGCNLGNTKVLPENQLGGEKEHKWVVFKSHEGRCVIISDDPDDRRVELTGKKRNISNPPTGNTDSVYTIDGNQSTILFDERSGKEKVLIRTYKGDYLHIDIDEQKLQAYFKSDINIETGSNLSIKSGGSVKIQSGGNYDVKSGGPQNFKSGSAIHSDAPTITRNTGSSSPQSPDPPKGDRDT